MNNITILGSGLAANMMAAYLRKRLPNQKFVMLGRRDKNRPLVGESLVEYSSRFFYEVGAGHLLEERQQPKLGLTFYHKESLDDPSCRRYFQHETPGLVSMPSFHVNRERFDDDFEAFNRANGVEFVDGWIKDIELGTGGAPHRITYETEAGELKTVESKWIVDGTGRRGIVARKAGVRQKAEIQRSSFWIRLEDFDPNILSNLELIKRTNHCYDSYNVSHHFFGRGNWIWLIPMVSEDEEPRSRFSIGLTWRPDMFPHEITKPEHMIEAIEKEHPAIAELIRSGRVELPALYRNYLYTSSRYYSRDRWFLVGDSAVTYDPLFSNGIMLNAAQVNQIAAIIKKDEEGTLTDAYIDGLDTIFASVVKSRHRTIPYAYTLFHEPIRLAWWIWPGNAFWFFTALPFLMNGWHTDASLAEGFMRGPETPNGVLDDLAMHVSERLGGVGGRSSPEVLEAMENHMALAINWGIHRADGTRPSEALSNVVRVHAQLRLKLAKLARIDMRVKHTAKAMQELAFSTAMRAVSKLPLKEDERPFDFVDGLINGAPLDPGYWPHPRPYPSAEGEKPMARSETRMKTTGDLRPEGDGSGRASQAPMGVMAKGRN